ncbi:MAG TPA: phospholipid carrier-dependent glycosyltransferase [Candidatus Paceibacterota bacterium]|nr:phospholipid carrier-dependent glycosyltransferase [Candidatus Paceibacterota bacterium]
MTFMSNKRKLLIIILLAVSFGTHFAFFGHPNQTVFDEVYFGKFASAYYTHEYYFDIHPPLGKLIIAGFGKLFNFQPEYSFAQIGQPFPDHKYLALRFLPTLAGALLALIVFYLALELGFSDWSAFGAGILVALDNALLTQSRLILLDPFLLLFGFSGLLCYFKYRNRDRKIWFLLGAGVLFGLAASIKWTGLAFLGLAGLLELIDWFRTRQWFLKWLLKMFLLLVVVPFVVYFSVFAIHFSLLYKPGDGDAFMSPNFHQENLIQKFSELNLEMYNANKTLTAGHPYGSPWYTWPFMIRPIYYWLGTATPVQPLESKIYLLGNPFIWWASTVAVIYLILSLVLSAGKDFFKKNRTALILLGGWAFNYLPFIGIGRVMFLYHYLSALVFAILIFAYLMDQTQKKARNWLIVIAIAAACFIFFAPLTYGLPLSPQAFQHRIWLKGWQ